MDENKMKYVEDEQRLIARKNEQLVFDWVVGLVSDQDLEKGTELLNIRRKTCGLKQKVSGIVGEVIAI